MAASRLAVERKRLAKRCDRIVEAAEAHIDRTNHLPAGAIVPEVQLAVFTAWTALVVAAARRHKLASAVFAPLLPAYWAMHWTASWRGLYQLIRAPFLWEKTPHTATAAA